jgi:flavin-dependent dehydrogenase
VVAPNSENQFDVVIIGGGPGGSTTGTLLKKYSPNLKVAIFEREEFPREHIGESQLPPVGRVLNEMGVWDKVEAANFPVKMGATYTWGKTTEPWTFGFSPEHEIEESVRPARYTGWRTRVAFQVDRAIYDDILLTHAQEMGCHVRQKAKVAKIHRTGDRIDGVELESGEIIRGRYYVDASGNAAVIRRAMGVEVDAPTLLRNVAFWDYWERPGMNRSMMHKEAIRIHIRSIGYGWVWYIVLSDDRTSVGVVMPAEYYKKLGKRPEQVYHDSLKLEKQVMNFLEGAKERGDLQSTNDWSYIADRAHGENWFLCGECLGFADPILSAGLTLTHTCGRHLAYLIMELERGELDRKWLLDQYNEIQRRRVLQHMKFADYWYTGNGLFDKIRENCAEIGKASGLKMDPQEAFRWLSNGGVDDEVGQVAIGGLDLAGIKQVQQRLSHLPKTEGKVQYMINGKSTFKLNLVGAEKHFIATLQNGRIVQTPALRRGNKNLVLTGGYGLVVDALKKHSEIEDIAPALQATIGAQAGAENMYLFYVQAIQCLEVMANDYWVTATTKKGKAVLTLETPEEGELIYTANIGPPSRAKKAKAVS